MVHVRNNGFIDSLLAPLPIDEEQADTKEYRRQIKRDLMMVWCAGMDHVRLADARHMIKAITLRTSPVATTAMQIERHEAFNERLEAEAAQCLIPAPSLAELRWKKRRLSSVTERPAVAAAIAADAIRLGDGK